MLTEDMKGYGWASRLSHFLGPWELESKAVAYGKQHLYLPGGSAGSQGATSLRQYQGRRPTLTGGGFSEPQSFVLGSWRELLL